MNCIDSPLLLEGRELRLVSAGGRVHGPHGLGLLRRPPRCPADRLAGQGRSGPGRGSGQGRGQTRQLGAGGRPLKPPRRLPPPSFSAPGHQCPSPEPRSSTPPRSAHLRAPAAACASLLRAANQHPERRGGNAAIQPAKAGRRGGASWRRGGARGIEGWRAARFHQRSR